MVLLPIKKNKWFIHSGTCAAAALWCAGLLAGACMAAGCSGIHHRIALYPLAQVSLAGLLRVPVLPLLFSVVLLRCSLPGGLLPVIFTKAFLFGFCSSAAAGSFGAAGFLMQVLLLFTDLLTVPALWLFWIRRFYCGRDRLLSDSAVCLVWFFLVSLLDYFGVCPMIRDIFLEG